MTLEEIGELKPRRKEPHAITGLRPLAPAGAGLRRLYQLTNQLTYRAAGAALKVSNPLP